MAHDAIAAATRQFQDAEQQYVRTLILHGEEQLKLLNQQIDSGKFSMRNLPPAVQAVRSFFQASLRLIKLRRFSNYAGVSSGAVHGWASGNHPIPWTKLPSMAAIALNMLKYRFPDYAYLPASTQHAAE